jgi:hypothetical protein
MTAVIRRLLLLNVMINFIFLHVFTMCNHQPEQSKEPEPIGYGFDFTP